jgi:hypothetical protein
MFDPYALTLNALQGSTWLADELRADGRKVAGIEQYYYNVEIANLTQFQAGSVTLNLDPDSDFICLALSASVITEAPPLGQRAPLSGLLQITDMGTGRRFFDEPAYLATVCGGIGIPAILPTPKAFVANTRLQIEFENQSVFAGSNSSFFLVLCGQRVYYAN